jgi:hypothetical protein
MLYLFYGSDVQKVRSKAFEWVSKAQEKEPHLAYVRLSREDITKEALHDAAASGGLFVRRLLVLLDDPFPRSIEGADGESDTTSVVEESIDELVDSDNAIVIVAPKLLSSRIKKFEKKAKALYKFDAAARRDGRGFNADLVNALAARSREKLWLEVVRSLRAGDAPEMLHGLLHWKARDILEKGSRSWTGAESRALSLDLIALLQDTRRKGLNLAQSLERFALSL